MKQLLVSCIVLFTLVGCISVSPKRGPYQPRTEAERNPLEAQRLTQEANKLIDSDPAKAEQLLTDALSADLYHGPAHNNLGVVYLNQGKLYEAANEFEWARKLMPGLPDPRVNLGHTLELAGRVDEALSTYETALEVQEGFIPAIQALARCQLLHNKTTPDTGSMLREIALRGDSPRWRSWAHERLLDVAE